MHGQRVMVVGATGKIGKHLVSRLVEAENEVHGIARFGEPGQRERLTALGVTTYRRDVTRPDALADVPASFDYVFYEAAVKFGAEEDLDYTVELNVRAVGRAMEHFANTKGFLFASSGNVYADTPDGATEDDLPLAPSFYAITRLGGEWMVDYFSRRNRTPATIQRIFYGYHEEFGIPTDIARKVRDEEPIDLSTPYVNVIWLDDLLDMMIASAGVAAVPPKVLNITGLSKVSVRAMAERLGALMGKRPRFSKEEGGSSLLAVANEMARLLGSPNTPLDDGLRRVAESVMRREHPLDHPTQFERRVGFDPGP